MSSPLVGYAPEPMNLLPTTARGLLLGLTRGALLLAAFEPVLALLGEAHAALVALIGGLALAVVFTRLLAPAPRMRPDTGRRLAALGGAALLVLVAPDLIRAAAPALTLALGGADSATVLVCAATVAATLTAVGLALPPIDGDPRGATPIAQAAGLISAAALPLPMPAVFALAAVTCLIEPPRDRGGLRARPGGLPLVLALGLGLAAALPLLLAWRGAALPGREPVSALLLAGVAGFSLGPRLPRGAAAGLGLSFALAASWLLLDLSGGLFPLILPAIGGLPDRWLLAAPALASALVVGMGLGAVAPGGRALALGLVVGALASASLSAEQGITVALVLCAGIAFFTEVRGAQAAALVGFLALGALAAQRAPLPLEVLVGGQHRLLRGEAARAEDAAIRARQTELVAQIEPGLSQSLRTSRRDLEAVEAGSSRPLPWTLELDGTLAQSGGRQAEAEALAGHIGPLLAPKADRTLILGDDLGLTLRAARAHANVGAILSAMPAGGALRAMARLDSGLREAALDPRVHLTPMGPHRALLGLGEVDLLIAIARVPWAGGALLNAEPAFLDTAAAHLSEDGTFVLCLHTAWLDEGALRATLAAVAARFPTLTLWMPPTGVDSLLIVATPERPWLAELTTRAARVRQPLDALGFPNPGVLAGFAVASEAILERWPAGLAPRPSPRRLSQAAFEPPRLHLAGLRGKLGAPEEIWELKGAEAEIDALRLRIEGRDRLLALVQDAAAGRLEEVFTGASALAGGATGPVDPANQRALDALIEPQMLQAQAAVARARGEGGAARDWEDAQRLATTARALSPRSTGPLLIQGEVALAQSNFNRASESFEAALLLDPTLREAHYGLARVARARRDTAGALDHLRKAAVAWPQDWRTWQNVGVFLLEQGRPDEAIPELERALALAGEREAAPALALAEAHLAMGRPTDAMVYAERGVITGGGAWAHALRGRCNFELRRYAEAEEDFRRAVLDDPSLIEARGAIGQLRAMEGDWTNAAEAFRAVLARDPSNAAARENLNRVEARMGAEQRRTEGRQSPAAPR